MKKLIIKIQIISLLVSFCGQYYAFAAEGDDAFAAAFGNLKKTMGDVVKPDSNQALDQALEAEFNPIPAAIENSSVPLSQIDGPQTVSALKQLATTPINTALNIEYENAGMAVSLTLWSGSRDSLKQLFGNVVKQLYSDNDARNFRLVVNSSPIPKITATTVDFNANLRREEQQKAFRDFEVWKARATKEELTSPVAPTGPRIVDIPPALGVEIEMSAGMMATLKNVDEFAGQIAKVLSTLNPTLYGVKEDIRFTRNQKVIDMISELIDQGDANVKKELTSRRDEVIAELSAMERLTAGGFNPWALYNYEERVFSWMADVFMKSANYTLGSWILKSGSYQIDDWSRPIRMQLQAQYMLHLQSIERGKGMKKDFTEFSARMKYIRFRMNLFVKPFYSGIAFQVLPVVLATGAVVTQIFFPEVVHWVLAAVNATTTNFPEAIQAATKVADQMPAAQASVQAAGTSTEPTMVGQLIQKAQELKQSFLDSSFMNYDFTPVKDASMAAYNSTIEAFNAHHNEVLLAGGALIVATLAAKYSDTIGSFFEGLAKNLEARKPEQSPEIQLTEEDAKDSTRIENLIDKASQISATQGERAAELAEKIQNVAGEKREQVVVVMGSTRRLSLSGWALGKKVAQLLGKSPSTSLSFYEKYNERAEKTGEIIGQIFSGIARLTGEGLVASKNGIFNSAVSAKNSTVANLKAAGNGISDRAEIAGGRLLRGWEAFDRAAMATPRVVGKVSVGTVKLLYRGGRATVFGIGNGAKNFGLAGVRTAGAVGTAVGNKTMRGWEIFNGIAEATPAATVRGAKVAGKVALIIGGGLKTGAVKGSQMIFVSLPVGSYRLAAKGIGNAIAATKNTYIKARDARRKRKEIKQDRKERIADGIQRRADFFNDPDIKPSEVAKVMKEFNQLVYKGTEIAYPEFAREEWGLIKDRGFPNLGEVVTRAFGKWVEQAQKFGADSSEYIDVMTFMNDFYKGMNSRWRNDPDFVKACMGFYALFKAQDNEFMKGWLKRADSIKDPVILADMITRDRAINAKSSKTGAHIANAISTSGDNLLHYTINEVYKKNEAEIVKWLAAPTTTHAEFVAFFNSIQSYFRETKFNGASKTRFDKAIDNLTPIERSRILILAQRQYSDDRGGQANTAALGWAVKNGTHRSLSDSLGQTVARWVNYTKSIAELSAKIEADTKQFAIEPIDFRVQLATSIKENLNHITNYQDVETLIEKEYFWLSPNSDIAHSQLEKPLMELLKIKRAQFGDSPAWKYDPISAEQTHAAIKKRMDDLKIFPKDFKGLQKTWELFTSRGVSTVTDDILSQLLKQGTSDQINMLEDFAVRQGRVFDQGLKDEFAIRQLNRSEAYQELMKIKRNNKMDRKKQIEDVIRVAQDLMSDLGSRYVEFLEDLSLDILSTNEEAELIEVAKSKRFITGVQNAQGEVRDSRIKMLRSMLPYIKNWKPQNQFDFLLYLRGSIEATDFIKGEFPAFGPERIRKIYQGLPIESAMFVIDLYLGETFMARKEVSEGYGKRLMNYLVGYGKDARAEELRNKATNPQNISKEDEERAKKVKEYSALLLDGLLYGIDQAGDKPFQRRVLSALIAMKSNESTSIGETLKIILEQFPGVGPKIGQFLVGTGRLPPDINRVLIKTQDATLPPNRHAVYADLERIVKRGKDIGIELHEDLGQGSLKYTMKGIDERSKLPIAIQVFREDVQNSADLQIKILNHMIARLIKKGGKDWAFLQVVVDGAMNAVAREKVFRREAVKTALARRLYSKMSDADFSVAVPQQYLLNDRLLMSMFADGGSFHKMEKVDQQAVGLKILAMESEILFSGTGGVTWYDTDRHAGNFMVRAEMRDGKKHYVIAPIDFGQLTYIRHEQRDKVIELFAMAAMLGNMGANDWIAEKVGSILELNGKALESFKKNLPEFFPVKERTGELSVVTDYFSLIAAINFAMKDLPKDSLPRDLKTGKLDFAYTDFVRGIIQLNQYEKEISIPDSVMTPRKILEGKTKDKLAVYLKEVQLSRKQELGAKKINLKRWATAKVKGEEFIPIKIRLSREELEKLSIMPNDQIKEAEVAQAERIKEAAAKNSATTSSGGGGMRCEQMLNGSKKTGNGG